MLEILFFATLFSQNRFCLTFALFDQKFPTRSKIFRHFPDSPKFKEAIFSSPVVPLFYNAISCRTWIAFINATAYVLF